MFTVEGAKDGGLVVYADEGGTQQELVYAGNLKDACDYVAKRMGEIKPEPASAVPTKLAVVTRKQSLRDSLLNEAMLADA
jgi:hypothetical protein